MLIGLYATSLILVVANIWTILIKQRRYKTLLLLAFYIFAFFSIACRLIYILIDWTDYYTFDYYINDFFIASKLSVGLVQSWMIFEVALRERQAYKLLTARPTSTETFEKWLFVG